MPFCMLENVPHLSCESNGRLNVDHEDNGRKQDAWLREWLGASEGDYFESKGAKRKKLTPEERKEKAAKNGRQAQAAARRGEWTRNTTFGGFDPKCAGAKGTVGKAKGATSEERIERNLLPPAKIPLGTKLFFVGVCPCCGDKYLSNKTARQCQSLGCHETKGFSRKPLTLDKATSQKGEVPGQQQIV